MVAHCRQHDLRRCVMPETLGLPQCSMENLGVPQPWGTPSSLDGFCKGKSHFKVDDLGLPP